MTIKTLSRLQADVIQWAVGYYTARGFSAADAEHDAISVCNDLHHVPVKNEKEYFFARKRAKCRVKNLVIHYLTRKEQVTTKGISIDEAPHGDIDEDGNETNIESALISDNGRQAAAMGCPEYVPRYALMVQERVQSLYRLAHDVHYRRAYSGQMLNEQKSQYLRITAWRGYLICRLLMEGCPRNSIRAKMGLGKDSTQNIFNFFYTHFAQCLQAYHESRPEKKRKAAPPL